MEALPVWSWDLLEDRWNEAYEHLKNYVVDKGNARPAQVFKTPDGFVLGAWVANQRSSKDSLSEERVKLLEALPGWSWDLFADRWNEGYERLKGYVGDKGNARPAHKFKTADGFVLGAWVANQRSSKDSLSEERVKLLEALPVWSWDLLEDRWNEAYEHLKNYVVDKGNARPAQVFKTPDGFALGTWVSTQRGAKDSLSEERVKLLEALLGWSWRQRSQLD